MFTHNILMYKRKLDKTKWCEKYLQIQMSACLNMLYNDAEPRIGGSRQIACAAIKSMSFCRSAVLSIAKSESFLIKGDSTHLSRPPYNININGTNKTSVFARVSTNQTAVAVGSVTKPLSLAHRLRCVGKDSQQEELCFPNNYFTHRSSISR